MSEIHRKRIATGAGLSLGAVLVMPAAAQADDFQVTNLEDGSFPGPSGSLRRAVVDANTTAGTDRILFNSKLSGAIQLDGGLSIYGSNVEIVGPGARNLSVTDGGNSIFILYTGPSLPTAIDVAISGLSLTGNDVGNDKLKGKKGKDGLCGGRGKDKLIGGPGKDKFNGGPGKDKEIQ